MSFFLSPAGRLRDDASDKGRGRRPHDRARRDRRQHGRNPAGGTRLGPHSTELRRRVWRKPRNSRVNTNSPSGPGPSVAKPGSGGSPAGTRIWRVPHGNPDLAGPPREPGVRGCPNASAQRPVEATREPPPTFASVLRESVIERWNKPHTRSRRRYAGGAAASPRWRGAAWRGVASEAVLVRVIASAVALPFASPSVASASTEFPNRSLALGHPALESEGFAVGGIVSSHVPAVAHTAANELLVTVRRECDQPQPRH